MARVRIYAIWFVLLQMSAASAALLHPLARDVISRRSAAKELAQSAGLLASLPFIPFLPAFADTQAELDKPQEGFGVDEDKRKLFQEKQKKYKKAWRGAASDFEFSSNDDEAMTAIRDLIRLIRENNNEIPQGIRKQDLDQIYAVKKGTMGKQARMAFNQLDATIRDIISPKSLKGMDDDEGRSL